MSWLTDLFSKHSLDDRLLTGELSPDSGQRKARAKQLLSAAVVPAQERRSATATCPKGQALAFGGFVAPLKYPGEFVQIDRALRASGRAWTARALNTSTSNKTGTLRSLAYCRSRL